MLRDPTFHTAEQASHGQDGRLLVSASYARTGLRQKVAEPWGLLGSGLLWGLGLWQWDTQGRMGLLAPSLSHLAWGAEVLQEDLGQVPEPYVG